MLDRVKGGDAEELSPLLARGGGGSSFSHIVLISALRPRCGCVKSSGGSEALTFPAWLLPPPCHPRLHLCPPAHPCLLSIHLSAVGSPPLRSAASFPCSRKTLVSGKPGSSCPFSFSPPSPASSHCCRPQLCMCFTAAVKDKKQSLPPPLLFSARMSLPFL